MFSGGAREDRTPDLLRARQALSQLSYGPRRARDFVSSLAVSLRETARPLSPRARDFVWSRDPWWVWVDLNHRPRPYQGRALTN
jgi:hypothetical protein